MHNTPDDLGCFSIHIPQQSNMNTACLNFTEQRWNLYAEGYKRAVNVLLREINRETYEIDLLVYPILQLYRHYIELRLKEIIKQGSILVESEIKQKDFFSHDPYQLWSTLVKPIITQIFTDSDCFEVEILEDLIKEVSQLDPLAMAFRYPEDREGNPSLSGQKHLNLREYAFKMEQISRLLDGVSIGINVYIGLETEFEDPRIIRELSF